MGIIITNQTIENRGYANLLEVLMGLPEVEIQQKSKMDYGNSVSLRGIEGNEKFAIVIDDFRIISVAGTPDKIAGNYGLANVKQIEIIHEPASLRCGCL